MLILIMKSPKILSDGTLVIPLYDGERQIQSLTISQIAALHYFIENSEHYGIDNDFHLGENLYITLQNQSTYPLWSFKAYCYRFDTYTVMWSERSTYKLSKLKKLLNKYKVHLPVGIPCLFTHDDGNQESMLNCKNCSPDYFVCHITH